MKMTFVHMDVIIALGSTNSMKIMVNMVEVMPGSTMPVERTEVVIQDESQSMAFNLHVYSRPHFSPPSAHHFCYGINLKGSVCSGKPTTFS